MIKKLFDRSAAKDRRRNSERRRKRQTINNRLQGTEHLEERRLLAVTPAVIAGSGPTVNAQLYSQLFNGAVSPAFSSITDDVQATFKVAHGPDAAIVLVASYTESGISADAVDVRFQIDNDGDPNNDNNFFNDPGDIDTGFFPLELSAQVVQSSLNSTGSEQITSTAFVFPIGSSAMNRGIRVSIDAGGSTDVFATASAYHGVNQGSPVDETAQQTSDNFQVPIALPPGISSFGSSTLAGITVGTGNVVVDGIISRYPSPPPATGGPNGLLAVNNTLLGDTGTPHVAVLDYENVTGGNVSYAGGAGVDDDGTVVWDFTPSALEYAHVALEIVASNPIDEVYYDAGDAFDDGTANTFPTLIGPDPLNPIGAIHGPKGPKLGVIRDTETDGQPTVAGAANGDDIMVGLADTKTTLLTQLTDVNVSKLAGNQDESAIAINPLNPLQMFVSSNNAAGGLFAAFSIDGGATWSSSAGAGDAAPLDFVIADANDTLINACCDPTVSWDQYGNLFLGYIDDTAPRATVLAISTDSGATFSALTTLGTSTDQPTVTTGPGLNGLNGSVWVTYDESPFGAPVVIQGASVTGLGAVGAFAAPQSAAVGQFGDISIGPFGQVVVTGTTNTSATAAQIVVQTDPDGLGPMPLNAAITPIPTGVNNFDAIPPQLLRTIDAEVGLAYDRSGGPFNGRLYMVYTDEAPDESNNTDIKLRYSNDNGATWSPAVTVNDDATTRAQFFSKIAVDQTTGDVGIAWYDARNDVANTRVEIFATVSSDGGATFAPNLKVADGQTNGAVAATGGQQLGDYIGLAFASGQLVPSWADNSNSTGDNPAGALSTLDIYTSPITVQSMFLPSVGDDEDGLLSYHNTDEDDDESLDLASSFFVSMKGGTTPADIDLQLTMLPTGTTAYVTAWIDWDLSGTWEPSEQVLAGVPVLGDADGDVTQTFSIMVPQTEDLGTPTPFNTMIFPTMRIRMHTNMMGAMDLGPVLPVGGHANDGEVEDYIIKVLKGGEIAGTKKLDVNGNGLDDDGDIGMAGIPIDLEAPLGTQALNAYGNPVAPVITDGTGTFLFKFLDPAGTFVISEDLTQTFDVAPPGPGPEDMTFAQLGVVASGVVAGSNGTAGPVTPTSLQITVTFDADGDPDPTLAYCSENHVFLNYATASLHGFKFEDIDGSTTYNEDNPGTPLVNEAALEDVRFRLWRFVNSAVVGNVTVYNWVQVGTDGAAIGGGNIADTNAAGEFWYMNLTPGIYALREDLANSPSVLVDGDWVLSTGQVEGDPDDFIANNGTSSPPTAASGAFQINSGEELAWKAGRAMLNPLNPFKNEVVVTTNDTTGPLATQSLLFGNYLPAVVMGFKFEDYNGNGVRDFYPTPTLNASILTNNFFDLNGNGIFDGVGPDAVTEPAFQNVRFELLDAAGNAVPHPTLTDGLGNPLPSYIVSTDSAGKFTFEGIGPGTYMVRETLYQDTNTAADTAMFFGNPLVTLPLNDTYVSSTTTAALTAAGTTVAVADASLFPKPTGTAPFIPYYIQIDGDLMLVTAITANNLTVTRGPGAVAHAVGAEVIAGQDLVRDPLKVTYTVVSQNMINLSTGMLTPPLTPPNNTDQDVIDALNIIWSDTGGNTASGPQGFQPWLDYVKGSIHGVKYNDLNGDGLFNDFQPNGDPAHLTGVNFTLWRYTGSVLVDPFSDLPSTTVYLWTSVTNGDTNEHGEFWFSHLDPGIYAVRETNPGAPPAAPFQTTQQAQGSPNGVASPNPAILVIGDNPADPETGAIFLFSRQEYQWESDTVDGIGFEPPLFDAYDGEAYLRPMDDNGDGVISAIERLRPMIENKLKTPITYNGNEVGGTGTVQQSLLWGNVDSATIMGNKYEDFDGDGFTPGVDVGLDGIKFFIFRDPDGPGSASPFQVTTEMLAGGSNSMTPSGALSAKGTSVEGAKFTASTPGPDGNNISLVFNGVQNINTVVANWNAANPSNQVTLTGGQLGTAVLVSQTVNLSGVGQYVMATSDGANNGKFMFTDLMPGHYAVSEAPMQDSDGDGWDDVSVQGLVLSNNPMNDPNYPGNVTMAMQPGANDPMAWISGGDMFDFSALVPSPVDLNNDGLLNDTEPTYLWTNYFAGSIHGVKFEDLNGNGLFDDTRMVMDTTTLAFPGLTANFNNTTVAVNDSSVFPTSGYPYDIQIGNEILHVLNNNTATDTLTVAPRGVPMVHNPGDTVKGPNVNGDLVPAVLEGVAFQLFKFVGTRIPDPASFGGPYTLYDWTLVQSNTQFSDEHGEFWFTGLMPGQYAVRENLNIQMTQIQVGDVGTGIAPAGDYSLDISGVPVPVFTAVPMTNSELAQFIVDQYLDFVGESESPIKIEVVNNVITLSDVSLGADNEYSGDPIPVTLLSPDAVNLLDVDTFDYSSNYALSTDQPLGNPNTVVPKPVGIGYDFVGKDFGDNPAAAGTGTITVQSRDEFQWENDQFEGPGTYSAYTGPAYQRPMDGFGGPADGEITQDEIDYAIAATAFKNLDVRTYNNPENTNPLVPANAVDGTPQQSLLFGNYKGASIWGTKYIVNQFIGDTVASREGLDGIVMELTGTAITGTLTAVTYSGGSFHFDGLAPGTYFVRERVAQDLNNDGIDDPTSQGLHTDLSVQTVTLSSGQSFDFDALVDLDNNPATPPVPTYEWYNWIETSFHGIKFHDINANGVMDDLVDHDGDGLLANGNINPTATPERQAVLEGVCFQIYYYTGMEKFDVFSSGDLTVHNWTLVTTECTDVHGEFWFTGLKPGIYTIRENLNLREDLGGGLLGPDYSGFVQSTGQSTVSPIADFNPAQPGPDLGANPLDATTGAIANLNVYSTGPGTGDVRGYVDVDPSINVMASSPMTINRVNSPGYNGSPRSFPPTYTPPAYSGYIGGEYQWSNGTGNVPYEGPAFQRPMDSDNSGFIDGTEPLDAIVGTALKQAGTLDGTSDPTNPVRAAHTSLIWGNYVPVKIIGQKYEDLDADGVYDDGSDADHFVFDDSTLGTDIPMENVKFELIRISRSSGGAITNALPVTTEMLAGGSNSINPTMQLTASATIGAGTFTANNKGPIGNKITLVFDGAQTITTVVANWNAANPLNMVTFAGAGGTVLPAQVIKLSGAGDLVTVLTDATGMYMFQDVVPGEYVVRETKDQDTNAAQDAAIPGIMANMLPIDDIQYQGFVRDTYGDASADMMQDGQTIVVTSAIPTVANPVNSFDFSTPVDDGDGDPTNDEPTHIWLNYITGSIHGVKYEDIDGDGNFDDTREVTTTTMLTAALGNLPTNTTVKVNPAIALPTTYPYDIVIDKGLATEEVLTVVNNNTTGTLTVLPRGVPMAHALGATVTAPTTNPPTLIPATLEGVAFQLYRFVGTRFVDNFSHVPDFTVYDWEKVGTEYTDVHGEYWFNDLKPGIYTARENLDLQQTKLTILDSSLPGGLDDPNGTSRFEDGDTITINGMTYEFEIPDDPDGYVAGVAEGNIEVVIAFLDTTSQAAAALGDVIHTTTGCDVDVMENMLVLGVLEPVVENSVFPPTFTSMALTPDYSNFAQSTDQAQGNPNTNLDSLPPGFEFTDVVFGDNPALAANSSLTIQSRQEYQWEADVTPGVGFEGPGLYNAYAGQAYQRAMDLDHDGVISPSEKLAILKATALKTPVTQPLLGAGSLIYGNYEEASIWGTKYIVEQFIGDTVAARSPLPGIVMELLGGPMPGTLTAVTESDGSFHFDGLAPGSYLVRERLTQDLNGDGIDDPTSQGLHTDGGNLIATVSSGQSFDFDKKVDLDNNPATPPVPTYEWFNWIETSFHGLKFHDLNADGIANDLVDHDNDDPDGNGYKADGITPATPMRQAVLEGVGFEIYYYTGMQQINPFSNGEITVHSWTPLTPEFTDVHGEFWFTGLKPGIYTIRENLNLREDLGGGLFGPDYSGYFQSTVQAQGSPDTNIDTLPPGFLPADVVTGDDPKDATTGAIANLNVLLTGAGIGNVNGYVDTDPGPGVVPSSAMTINRVDSPGYNGSTRDFLPEYDAPAYTGFIGGEYQWSNGTGVAPYKVAAFQRPMDTNNSGLIERPEALAAIVGTALKQAGTLNGTANASTGGYQSLLWGNYVPVKVIGEKFEDLDGDGVYDDGSDADHFVFDNPPDVDIPMENVKFELIRILRDGGGAITAAFPLTTEMLAGGSNSINPTGPLTPTPGDPVFALSDANGMFMFADVVPGEYVARETLDQDTNAAQDALIPGIMPSMLPIDDILVQGFVRDTYGDATAVPMGDNGESIVVFSSEIFNFSTPVDDSDPTTVDEPTHIWLNYIKGSIHGVKFEDLNGDGIFNDTRVLTNTTTLVAETATTITVPASAPVPAATVNTPYEINVDGETMMVTKVTTSGANKVLTVIRTKPELHTAGDTVTFPTTNPAKLIPAVLEGVAFQLYRYGGSVNLDIFSFTPDAIIHQWTLVETQLSDVHGEYWFNDLDPGIYTVRENLDIETTVLKVKDGEDLVDTDTFIVDGITYEIDYPANSGVTGLNVPVLLDPFDDDGEIAAKIASAIQSQYTEEFSASATGNVVHLNKFVFDPFTFEYSGGPVTFDLSGIADTSAIMGMSFDYTGFAQSTSQAQGYPGPSAPLLPDFTFDLTQLYAGDDPALPESSALPVQSRLEYQWEGDIVPGTGFEGGIYSAYKGPAYQRAMDLDGDGVISPSEQLAILKATALKTPVTQPLLGPGSLIYGNYEEITIKGFKYEDINGNGVWDQSTTFMVDSDGNGMKDNPIMGEPAFEGIVFVLTGKDGMNNSVTLTAETGSDGMFQFEGLKPGTYKIGERMTAGPGGLIQDTKAMYGGGTPGDGVEDVAIFDPLTGAIINANQGLVLDDHIEMVTVSSGDLINFSDLMDDDGILSTPPTPTYVWLDYVLGSIHGFKFQDYNRDGSWDESASDSEYSTSTSSVHTVNEPPLAGVKFELWKLVGSTKSVNENTGSIFDRYRWEMVDMMESDVHGEFWFTNLMPGNYVLRENLADSTVQDLQQTSEQDPRSPADFVARNTLGKKTQVGEAPVHNPALGRFQVLSREEYVWEVRTDPAIPVHIMPIDANNNNEFDDDEIELATQKAALKIPISEYGSALQFGNNYIPGAYHGFKYEDLNGNGVYDPESGKNVGDAEPGIPKILVGLIDETTGEIAIQADGTPALMLTASDNPATTKIDETGHFWFKDLVPNRSYTLVEFLNGRDISSPGSNIPVYVPVDANGDELPLDHATWMPFGISDSNMNGIPDGLEMMYQSSPNSTAVAIGSLEAYVYAPGASLMEDPVTHVLKPMPVPGQNTNRLLAIPRQGVKTQPSLIDLTKLAVAKTFTEVFIDTAPTNGVNDNLMIGNYVTGSVHGFKYADINADGIYQPIDGSHNAWDVPMEWAWFGLEVRTDDGGTPNDPSDDVYGPAVDANGVLVPNQMTGNDGQFWFTNLPPGQYRVTELIDLIDRNDTLPAPNGNGFPDGNGTPDTDEGLFPSDPDHLVLDLTIDSRQEYVWTNGAAMLREVHSLDPDDLLGVPNGTDITNAFPNVTLHANMMGPVFKVIPLLDVDDPYPATTGFYAYGSNTKSPGVNASWGGDEPNLNVTFSVAVKRFSVDIINNDGDQPGMNDDQGEVIAFNAAGNLIAQSFTSVLGTGEWENVTVVAPPGQAIASIRIRGIASDLGLDNMEYETFSLKEEILVGPELMFGNYYAGAVHGTKVQQDPKTGLPTNVPAPNITLELVDMQGVVYDTAITNVDGEYWFTDVKPGMYSLREQATPSVLITFNPVPVQVDYATVLESEPGLGMPYPGLQTVAQKPSLAVSNLVEGSIHGIRKDSAGNPIGGVTIELVGAGNVVLDTTVTDPVTGEFDFEGIDPRQSFPSGSFLVREVSPASIGGPRFTIVPVHSGQELDWDTINPVPLDPGQYETDEPSLMFSGDLFGSIHGVIIDDVGVPQPGRSVVLFNSGGNAVASTTTGNDGTFSFEDLLAGDYSVRAVGQIVSVNIVAGEEEVFIGNTIPLDPGQTETFNPELVIVLNALPNVTNLRVNGSTWAQDFRNNIDAGIGLGYAIPVGSNEQLTPVPWLGVNQLVVSFSEDVRGSGLAGSLDVSDFDLVADDPTNTVGIASIASYNPVTGRAVLQLDGILRSDRYTVTVKDSVTDVLGVQLDGEWTNKSSTYPSGDGTEMGDFVFRFAVSIGNASALLGAAFDPTGLGAVNLTDLTIFTPSSGADINNPLGPTYNAFADFTGDGKINLTDLAILTVTSGNALPPDPMPFMQSLDQLFGNEDEVDDLLSQEVQGLF